MQVALLWIRKEIAVSDITGNRNMLWSFSSLLHYGCSRKHMSHDSIAALTIQHSTEQNISMAIHEVHRSFERNSKYHTHSNVSLKHAAPFQQRAYRTMSKVSANEHFRQDMEILFRLTSASKQDRIENRSLCRSMKMVNTLDA